LCRGCSVRTPDARSRAWNDAKITAHHAIIPTTALCQIARMSESERRIYDLVRRRYLAQFYPSHEFDKTEVQLRAGEGDQLRATGKRIAVPGWRELFGDADDDTEVQALPALVEGDRCQVAAAEVEAKKTTPPAHYTEGTLIAAMKHVSRLVEDPQLAAASEGHCGDRHRGDARRDHRDAAATGDLCSRRKKAADRD
jgi:DNA topoisomerase III